MTLLEHANQMNGVLLNFVGLLPKFEYYVASLKNYGYLVRFVIINWMGAFAFYFSGFTSC